MTNESSQAWATRNFALPIGLSPDIFAYGGFVDPIDGNEFSPGGGQMMSCRDQARIAQLLINKGRWADDAGPGSVQPVTSRSSRVPGALLESSRPFKQLVTEDFVAECLRPSFPSVSQSYGFLLWLNREVNADGCCSSRWGGSGFDLSLGVRVNTCRTSMRGGEQLIGAGIAGAERAPRDLAIGMGQSAKFYLVVPSQGLTVVSLGLSWSSSSQCPLGDYPLGPNVTLQNGTVVSTAGDVANSRGYDDTWGSTQLWRSIGNLTALMNKSLESDLPVLMPAARVVRRAWPSARGESRAAETEQAANAVGNGGAGGQQPPGRGACYAYCPPKMGFGVCFTMPVGTLPGDCSAVLPLAGAVCPAHGNPRQCQSPPVPDDTACDTVHLAGKPNCTLVGGGCQSMPGAGKGGLLPANDGFLFAGCLCHPTRFEGENVVWTDAPCVYSPFMPPSPVEV